MDFKGERYVPVFEQGSLSMSLDEMVGQYGLPQPTHIKIDVDGLESAVIKGAQKVLRDERLRDILIEINEGDESDTLMVQSLEHIGFRIVTRGEPVIDVSGRYRMRNVVLSREKH